MRQGIGVTCGRKTRGTIPGPLSSHYLGPEPAGLQKHPGLLSATPTFQLPFQIFLYLTNTFIGLHACQALF